MDGSMPQIVKQATIILLVWKLMREIREGEEDLKKIEQSIQTITQSPIHHPRFNFVIDHANSTFEEIRSDLTQRKEFVLKIRSDYPEINFDSLIPVGF
jgi:hypothetical protein